MAVEAKRGCGYRKVGGLYLVGGGLSAPCDRMPFPLDRCKVCGGGIKFTRGPQWLLPEFFKKHGLSFHFEGDHTEATQDEGSEVCECRNCPVCNVPPIGQEFGPHLLLWIGRAHYTPESYLKESRELGVSRRLSAMPKGLVLGQTWVLMAHLDAVPAKTGSDRLPLCGNCGGENHEHPRAECKDGYHAVEATPGIFCAFVPRAVELILKESEATPERREKEEKRGVTIVTVPDDDKDHQGSVWEKDEDSQPELPGVSP